jgi:hypothetical protein
MFKLLIPITLLLLLTSCWFKEELDLEKQERIKPIKKIVLKENKEKVIVDSDFKQNFFDLCRKAIEKWVWCNLNEEQIEFLWEWEVLKSKDFILIKRTNLTPKWTKQTDESIIFPSFIWWIDSKFRDFSSWKYINLPVGTSFLYQKYKIEILKKITKKDFYINLKKALTKSWRLEEKNILPLIELLKKSIEKSNWVSKKNIDESKIFLIWNIYQGLLIDELWTWKEYNYWDNICIELKWKKECWILSNRKEQDIELSKQIIWNYVVLVWLKEWTKFKLLSNWWHKWWFSDLIILKS